MCPKPPDILKANDIYFWWKKHDTQFQSEKETQEFLRSKGRWAVRFWFLVFGFWIVAPPHS